MTFEMTMDDNLLLMETLTTYRIRTVKNQRLDRRTNYSMASDLFWAERNRKARHLYRRLVKV